jgi:hypothetical protein
VVAELEAETAVVSGATSAANGEGAEAEDDDADDEGPTP